MGLAETKIADIMIPRTQIEVVKIGAPSNQVVGQIRDSGTTRLPVYRDSLDDIVGILHSKDVIRYSTGWVSASHFASRSRPVRTS